MIITDKKVIELEYELRIDSKDGKLAEKVNKDKPLQFISGIGVMLPKFEENIYGLKVGDKFSFKLESKDAYGTKQDNMIVDLHKEVFKINGEFDEKMLVIGNVIPMVNQEGHHLNGKVLEVGKDTVKLDFNHPLADKDLFFKGSVVGIRDASEKEIAHGHVHNDNHGCGGGCGCH